MIQFLNATFNETVKVGGNEEAKFIGCKFIAKGSSTKDHSTPGLLVKDSAKVEIQESEFNSMGYNALSIQTGNEVNVHDCTFECDSVYNPIEGTVSGASSVKNANIVNNTFNGSCGNNFISFYKMEDKAVVNIEGNVITGAKTNNNILRLSNPDNVTATFNVTNNSYIYVGGEADDYTGFMLCQDFTAKSGNPEDFSMYNVNIENLVCNDTKVIEEPVVGSLYYVYQDGVGIITGTNDPIITLK